MGSRRGCWSSTTGAGPTSATCSASPTRSTPARRLHVVDAAGAAADRRLARLPLVPGPPRRLSRSRHLPRRPRGARRAPRRALGGDRDRARPHRPRRLLDGRGDELRDGALGGPARGRRAPRLQRLRPDRRGLAAELRGPPRDRASSSPTAATTRSSRSASPAAPASCSRPAASRSPIASPTSATRSTRRDLAAAAEWLAGALRVA